MKTHKTLILAFMAISTALLFSTARAMDGAELYKERTCIACHGAEGNAPVMSNYPKLAGQTAEYLLAQMKDIKSGARNNADTVAMKSVMDWISDEEMDVVAKWLAGLPAAAQPGDNH